MDGEVLAAGRFVSNCPKKEKEKMARGTADTHAYDSWLTHTDNTTMLDSISLPQKIIRRCWGSAMNCIPARLLVLLQATRVMPDIAVLQLSSHAEVTLRDADG